MKSIEIFTDGACSGNPGPGGFGAILYYKEHRKELSGGFRNTTNNRMELYAAIAALELLREPCDITLYSDSSYLVNAYEKHWLVNWQKRNWRKRDNQPVLNADLWQRFLAALQGHRLKMVWVKGHAENADNNRCDELAREATARRQQNPPDVEFEKLQNRA